MTNLNLLSSNIPRIPLPDGQFMPVLHPVLINHFPSFTPAAQRRTIRTIEGLLDDIRLNSSMKYLFELGVVDEEDVKIGNECQEHKKKYLHDIIDACCWQLSLFMKYSVPNRIGEAVPHLTYIIESRRSLVPHVKDPIAILHLGVALAHVGEDERAIEMLKAGLSDLHYMPVPDPKNMLWSRVHFAWLLRKAGKISEAKSQERLVCEWIFMNQFFTSRQQIIKTITDDAIPEIGEHVVKNPALEGYFNATNVDVPFGSF
ncbi:hypothetical protein CVT24_010796 [Panaeolus cyanescens]|uniref:Tetratricopeptide repeat protein n=1 Tax=Panaeolus cyanescens TaxID=181874 RepID=A0A409VGV9_9AGAR|nr:hypothetical protein CVT24_010796 [Panaeolus cyanescens]